MSGRGHGRQGSLLGVFADYAYRLSTAAVLQAPYPQGHVYVLDLQHQDHSPAAADQQSSRPLLGRTGLGSV